jgi:tetratricopeptide (TPR) repeat protein
MKPRRQAELHLKRARKAVETRRYPEAYSACREALLLDPTLSDAYLIMGEVASIHGQLERAVDLFHTSSLRDPRNLHALVCLARALIDMHRFKPALEAASRALDLKPRDAGSLHRLGLVFANAGDHAQAVSLFQEAVKLVPRNATYLYDFGVGLQIMGESQQSEAVLRRCIDADPRFYRAYAKIIELNTQTNDRNYVTILSHMLDQSPDDIERSLTIGYALAKTYDDVGDIKAGLDSLRRGKQPMRRQLAYRYDDDQEIFAAAADTLSGAFRHASQPAPDAPIFVIGMPRSGTSLVDRIVSSHPLVSSAGELQTIAILIHRLTGVGAPRTLQAEAFRRARSTDLSQLGRDYLSETAALTGAAPRIVDKLPFNFFFAGVIHRALPNARIICLRRDPVDVCLSNYRTFFSPGSAFHGYSYDLCDIARYYVLFDRLMAHWSDVLPGNRFMSLRYEDLVSDQEAQTRRLLKFCGLDWDARCLDFQNNAAGLMTASILQVRKPMFTTSIGRWRRYGDVLAPMIDILTQAGVLEGAS